MIEIVTVVGIIALCLSICVKIIGDPSQIQNNWKQKSTQGLSTLAICIAFSSYSIWTIYGVLKNDLFISIGNGLGVITMGIILLQIYVYRKNKN